MYIHSMKNSARFVLNVIGEGSLTMNDIVRLGGNQGYTKDQIHETVELLLHNGYIYEPISGHFRKHRDMEKVMKNENE